MEPIHECLVRALGLDTALPSQVEQRFPVEGGDLCLAFRLRHDQETPVFANDPGGCLHRNFDTGL